MHCETMDGDSTGKVLAIHAALLAADVAGAEDGTPDAVGRVERLLYDGLGRFTGFELGTRDGTVFVGACATHVERMALRACRQGLRVRVWYDHDAREAGRQLVRIAVRA